MEHLKIVMERSGNKASDVKAIVSAVISTLFLNVSSLDMLNLSVIPAIEAIGLALSDASVQGDALKVQCLILVLNQLTKLRPNQLVLPETLTTTNPPESINAFQTRMIQTLLLSITEWAPQFETVALRGTEGQKMQRNQLERIFLGWRNRGFFPVENKTKQESIAKQENSEHPLDTFESELSTAEAERAILVIRDLKKLLSVIPSAYADPLWEEVKSIQQTRVFSMATYESFSAILRKALEIRHRIHRAARQPTLKRERSYYASIDAAAKSTRGSIELIDDDQTESQMIQNEPQPSSETSLQAVFDTCCEGGYSLWVSTQGLSSIIQSTEEISTKNSFVLSHSLMQTFPLHPQNPGLTRLLRFPFPSRQVYSQESLHLNLPEAFDVQSTQSTIQLHQNTQIQPGELPQRAWFPEEDVWARAREMDRIPLWNSIDVQLYAEAQSLDSPEDVAPRSQTTKPRFAF